MRNYSKNINLLDALKIELASKGAVKWYLFMDNIDEKIKQRIEKGAVFHNPRAENNKNYLSQKILKAIQYENKLGLRQGKRSDLKLRANCSNEVNGRTDKKIAKLFNIDSAWAYRQAKKVILLGCPELIQAMDEWLSVSSAAKLTRYSLEKQRSILRLTQKEIISYANK